MGEQNVSTEVSNTQLRSFMRLLLADVHALQRMIDEDSIETGVRRIGAEQEMFLIDRAYEPAAAAGAVLEKLNGHPQFTTELAQFNLECNLLPRELGGACLSEIEKETEDLVGLARKAARECEADVLLTGILPTVELKHLGLDNMTPNPRYHALNRAMTLLRGGRFQTYIKGIDELQAHHDNVMMESCNTSFQVHFQVGPKEFPSLYNLAQVVTAPVLAAAVNSPVMLKHRLWHETRVALFQQSVDSRSLTQTARGQRTRVSFGDRWITNSVLEIFRDDIARFRVVLAQDLNEDPNAMLDRGEMPPLTALRLHNGTVYRWNRACYGVQDNVAHLRIENRVLPAGPTIQDEVANAAFFFGLMSSVGEEYGDVTQRIAFDEAKSNFLTAARYGLKARLTWLDGCSYGADELILKVLLPMARQGLKAQGIYSEDSDRYLSLLEHRVASGQTGAQWMFDSLQKMGDRGTKDERYRTLTGAILRRQVTDKPCHRWPLAHLDESHKDWRDSYRIVGQVMKTDLFTVHPEDSVDLTASMMDWEHIRHVPVEDEEGRLVGLVSHRSLLRLLGGPKTGTDPVAVREIMHPDPFTVTPETDSLEAIELMRRHNMSCLPVVEGGQLVGIVTDADFMDVAHDLLKEYLSNPN